MDAMGKGAPYKEEFRREILDAARDLFVNEGYEHFSMSKLAEKTGCSPRTIYSYFMDKDDLLFAICEEVAGRFIADLTYIKTAHSDPLESLRQALLYLVEFGFNYPDEYRVLFITGSHVYGTLDEFMAKESMARNSYFVLREIVSHCMETGKLLEIDVDVLTQVLTSATRGLALTLRLTAYPWIDRNVLAHTLVEGLLRSYRR
jgi:AcrR family transcriptional regulator